MSARNAIEFSIGANSTAVKTGLAEARNYANDFKKEIGSMFAGAFAVGGIIETARSVGEYAGRVRDLSDRFGDSAESIQKVDYAARQSGSNIEQVAKAIQKVTQNAIAARDGNAELAAAFDAMGIKAGDFVNLPLEDKLVALSTGLQTSQGDGEKLALVLDLLGKSGGELVPLLKAGPDALADAMGEAVVMTQREIEKIDDLSDRIAGYGQQVRSGLGSAFVFVGDKIEQVVERSTLLWRAAFRSFSVGIGQAYAEAKQAADQLEEDREAVDDKREDLNTDIPGGIRQDGHIGPVPGAAADPDFAASNNAAILSAGEARAKRIQGIVADGLADAQKKREDSEKEIREKWIAMQQQKLQQMQQLFNSIKTFQVDDVRRIGGGLGGVNYSAITANVQQQQLNVLERMQALVKDISEKEYSVDVPEAQF